MTLKQIEERAMSLLEDLSFNYAPVPIKKIIKRLDVGLKPDELGDEISGLLVIESNRAVIGYNSQESIVRQRFTMAHEIGHFLLHCDKNSKNQLFIDNIMYRRSFSSESERRREMQANAFAAAILMPQNLIESNFNELIESTRNFTDEDIIEELASMFKVSNIAMTYRLMNLNLLSR